MPAGRLVFFHNHGEPGPGVYLPSGWHLNRARWDDDGHTVPSDEWAGTLEPLPVEGFYRVRESFTCCSENCQTFEAELLVQLGYDEEANPLLFVPEWTGSGLAIPEIGVNLDTDRLRRLAPLIVEEADEDETPGVH